ncbi:TPA: hypothetical protein G9F27_003378 [Salmonella enterica]|uniref:Uncharacterized protein n=1 Tax=Salmonella enterica TaxID=28901 RepID=A0A743P718_SALER|nr:hypothetical protein [Salmonella enterica]
MEEFKFCLLSGGEFNFHVKDIGNVHEKSSIFNDDGYSVVVSGAAAKTIQKVAQMESDIKWLPDAHGKTHATIVKGDAAIPVDKIELYLRGKASGDLTTLKADYNALKYLQVKNQSQFAKDPNNFDKLRICACCSFFLADGKSISGIR